MKKTCVILAAPLGLGLLIFIVTAFRAFVLHQVANDDVVTGALALVPIAVLAVPLWLLLTARLGRAPWLVVLLAAVAMLATARDAGVYDASLLFWIYVIVVAAYVVIARPETRAKTRR